MRLSIALALLLAPSLAAADSPKWFAEPDASTTDSSVRTVRTLVKGGVAYFENDDATTDSDPLNVRACEPAVCDLNPDDDGTATGAEIYLHCADGNGATTLDTHTRHIMPDTDGDGLGNDVTYDGSTAERTARAFWCPGLLIVETSANPNPDEFRVTCGCY